ncbi:MAG: hypothetical protein ACI8WA_000479, partial [Polaribacter sp.]
KTGIQTCLIKIDSCLTESSSAQSRRNDKSALN